MAAFRTKIKRQNFVKKQGKRDFTWQKLGGNETQYKRFKFKAEHQFNFKNWVRTDLAGVRDSKASRTATAAAEIQRTREKEFRLKTSEHVYPSSQFEVRGAASQNRRHGRLAWTAAALTLTQITARWKNKAGHTRTCLSTCNYTRCLKQLSDREAKHCSAFALRSSQFYLL